MIKKIALLKEGFWIVADLIVTTGNKRKFTLYKNELKEIHKILRAEIEQILEERKDYVVYKTCLGNIFTVYKKANKEYLVKFN